MGSIAAAAVHVRAQRSIARLLGAVPAALLLSGLFTVWAGPLAAPVLAASGDWTQFHNGPTHEGYNTAETTLYPSNVPDLDVVWTGATGDEVLSSPAVADGVVYIRSGRNENGKLSAYGVGCASGGHACTALWTAALGDSGGTPDFGVNSSPAVADGVVYVASDKLYAFDAAGVIRCTAGSAGSPKTCLPLWTGTIGIHGSHSSPALAGNMVYVGAVDGELYAFQVGCSTNGGNCTAFWTGAIGGNSGDSSPAVAGSMVYIGSSDGDLYAFDAAGATDCTSGPPYTPKICTPLWTGAAGDHIDSSPAVAGGVVYVGSEENSGGGNLYAFDAAGNTRCSNGGGSSPKTCLPLWVGAIGAGVYSSPAVTDGRVYVGSLDHNLYAFAVGCAGNGGTCPALWTGGTGDEILSSPAVANGVVYVGSEDGKLYAFDATGATDCTSGSSPNTCTSLWTGDTGSYIDSSPAVADGVVYIGSTSYKLYAFGLPATPLTVSGIANPYVAGAAHSVTVTAKDPSGHTATAYRGTIHFTSSDTQAVLPADYTFTAADKGSHKFTGALTLKTAGARTVKVTDTAHSSIKGSRTVTVTPAAARTLKVGGTTNPTVAGAAHSVTVTALDADGNVATGYTGTIHFTSSDAQAVLPGDYTFSAGDAGSHKFTGALTLKTAGARSVTVTDIAHSSIKGSQTITVTPGAARTLSVSIAANPYPVGTAHSVTVKALDAYGNVATGYVGTIHFTSSDGAAVLPGDYTFLAGENGTHKFTSALTLNTTGSQWVKATDMSHSSITGSQTVSVE